MDAVRALELPWEVVHKDQQNHYVVVLAEDEPAADLLPVRRSHVGGQPLSELEANLETAEMKLEDIQGRTGKSDPLDLHHQPGCSPV